MHILATPVRKEMESEDIEDGEILEDESNDGEEPCEAVKDSGHPEEKNNFEPSFFNKEKRSHQHHPHVHRESHKSIRRDRSSFSHGLKKRKRSDDDSFRSNKFYGKKPKRSDAEDENDEDMMFMFGGSLRDVERKTKSSKSAPVVPSVPEDILDPMVYNEGENEDPRPYARRSPTERRDKMKRDRGLVRGVASGLLKRRRGRGGGPGIRKEKQRDSTNDVTCSFFAQGKCLRGNDCPYLHPYSQPRKLEICKFYLNDCCTKRDKCIYMHADFPCKYFHLPALTCSLGTKCKFSHSKLDEVQRAVLKKYADVPMKEIDEMQRFYRETGNNAFSSRSKEKKDSRIPSLFDIKVSVPPEYRGEGPEGDGVTTPIPSPESMIYENDNSEEKPHKHHHKHNKLVAQLDDSLRDLTEPTVPEITNKHKKKSRKSDEFSDGDRSRKHGEKKKKKSKKEDKDGEKSEKRKKKKEKRNKSENIEDAFTVGNNVVHEHAFEVSTEEKTEREPADAFAHLPKKQQELFLRIQQHQKEADTSQNANVDQENEEDDSKADVNWYSSDEEETPEPVLETTSPLATLLRTIQSSSSSSNTNVPSTEKKVESIPVPTHLFSSPSAAIAENESVPIVDASQLENIDLSDEVTKILTSIMKTETGSTHSDTVSNSLPQDTERSNDHILSSSSSSSAPRKAFQTSGMERLPHVHTRKTSSEDLGQIFRNTASYGINTPSNADSSPKDIDLRQLPFKPVPVHDAANEIDASITSHPPMEYKLRPLPAIPKVNYSVMIDAARNCARDDPRFKRRAPATPAAEPAVDILVKPTDPRFDLKTQSESSLRVDPRIRNDPRLAASKNMPAMTTVPVVPPTKADPRMEKESMRTTDFLRDPRLLTCNPFQPDGLFRVAATMAATAEAVTMLSAKERTSLRKEDPRLRFRTNQNA